VFCLCISCYLVYCPSCFAIDRLARVTTYSGEDKWSKQHLTSTGAKLVEGVCAVDPKVIEYGSTIEIKGIGKFKSLDTGTNVKNRKAAILSGKTKQEKDAIVIDIYCETQEKALQLSKKMPEYIMITINK
jgi:3D (Asp-Asp-Asp) domain-containing protein